MSLRRCSKGLVVGRLVTSLLLGELPCVNLFYLPFLRMSYKLIFFLRVCVVNWTKSIASYLGGFN